MGIARGKQKAEKKKRWTETKRNRETENPAKKVGNPFVWGTKLLGGSCADMVLSWEDIVQKSIDPTLALDAPRTPDVARQYSARGCTLDLDFRSEWLLVLNAYPYDTREGISHYVLFRRRDLDLVCPRTFLDAARSRFQEPVEFAWFENPEMQRSIHAVRHYHVFVRARRAHAERLCPPPSTA